MVTNENIRTNSENIKSISLGIKFCTEIRTCESKSWRKKEFHYHLWKKLVKRKGSLLVILRERYFYPNTSAHADRYGITGMEAASNICTLNKLLLKLSFSKQMGLPDWCHQCLFPTTAELLQNSFQNDCSRQHEELIQSSEKDQPVIAAAMGELHLQPEKPASTHPIVLQPLTSWITPLSERRKKNGTEALSHPAVNWSQTWDLASLLCCAAGMSLSKALQPGSPPFWENRRCISPNGRAQNGLRQLSASLSLLEMHRDMT